MIEASVSGLDVHDLDRRNFARGRRQEIGERGGEDIAGRVVDDLLEQGVGDALGDAAMHLAVGDHRVDQEAGVLDRDEALDPHAAGLDIDLDHRRVAGVGIGARRVVGGEGHQARILRGSRSDGSCDRRRAPARRSRPGRRRATRASPSASTILTRRRPGAASPATSRSRAASFSGGELAGAAADHHRPAGEGAPAIGGGVGIAMDDVDRRRARRRGSSATSWRSACWSPWPCGEAPIRTSTWPDGSMAISTRS